MALIGTFYFYGLIAGFIVFPRLSELYGRLRIFYYSYTVAFLAILSTHFISDLKIMTAVMTLAGTASGARLSVCYVYVSENLPKKNQTIFTSVWCAVESSIPMQTAFFF